jgi:hypothetical protein
LDHFTGLWDEPTARPLEPGAGAAVVAGAAVGWDVAVGAVARAVAVDRSVGAEALPAAVPELLCGAVELALSAECPVPDGESGAVARGVAGCVEPACGTNGALMLGPPSSVLISTAT